MGKNWIIDVLTDLRSFAQQNDLPLLADELLAATRVARAEIAAEGVSGPVVGDGAGTRKLSRQGGTCGRA